MSKLRNRLVLSLCVACGLAAVAPALADLKPASAPLIPVAAVGDEVGVHIACLSREVTKSHADMIAADKNYVRASEALQADVAAGKCGFSSAPVRAIVLQAEPTVSLVLEDGTAVEMQILNIEIGDRQFWSIELRKADGA